MPLNNPESRVMAIASLAKLIESLTHSVNEVFDEDTAAKRLAAAADLLGLDDRVCSYLDVREAAPSKGGNRRRR